MYVNRRLRLRFNIGIDHLILGSYCDDVIIAACCCLNEPLALKWANRRTVKCSLVGNIDIRKYFGS